MYKILFADDEQNVLQYLPIAIDWSSLGIDEIKTASDGRSALRIAKEFRPDIAIIDIEMPGMDGLEFCQKVTQILPEIKMVILSAFGRFDYAKRAISAGVTEYILKPVDEEELERVVRKIIADIEQTKKRSRTIEDMTLKALEKEIKEFFERLVRNEDYSVELEKSFPVIKDYENISIVVQARNDTAFPAGSLRSPELDDVIVISFEEGFWGFFWKRDITTAIDSQIKKFEEQEGKGHFRFFYTQKQREETALQALKRCFSAFLSSFYSQEYHIQAPDILQSFEKHEWKLEGLKDILNEFAEEGEVSGLEDLISGELKKAFQDRMNPLTICQVVFDVFITLKIYLTKCWQDEALQVFRNIDIWSFLRCGSQRDLYRLIGEYLDELQVFVKTQKETHGNTYIVKNAKIYTKEHFMDPDLSLQEVADAVGISRTYFSKVFKELTGEKYWDYLTQYRVNQARILLTETNMTQAEISEKIGYSSVYHFSRKFKEIVGVSPNKYRKT